VGTVTSNCLALVLASGTRAVGSRPGAAVQASTVGLVGWLWPIDPHASPTSPGQRRMSPLGNGWSLAAVHLIYARQRGVKV